MSYNPANTKLDGERAMRDHSDVKRLVAKHWSRRAADFDARPNHGLHNADQRAAWLQLLGDLTGAAPLDVLDVGCGTGFLALLLAELGHRAIGVDLSEEMLSHAREKAARAELAVSFRRGDAESLDAHDASIDFVVARHLIWTLPDPERAVREWRRILRWGGRLALIEGQFGNRTVQPEYETIHQRLPFFGGPSAEHCATFLSRLGLQDVTVQPLMDPVLWGALPEFPRYLVVGRS